MNAQLYNPRPNCWFRFSLRRMLVAFALLAIGLSPVAWNLRLLRE
jgi:hypothetical protein